MTLAASFAASMGSNQTNQSALASIAKNLPGVGQSSSLVSGGIGKVGDASAFLSGASVSLGNSAGNLQQYWGANSVGEGTLASAANASFSVGSQALGGKLDAAGDNALSGGGDLTVNDIYDPQNIPTSWVFITAPQDVSWDKQAQTSVVDNFGTNNPYVVYSSTGMRKLNLGETLIEGFSAGREVESHIIRLESMMNMVQNSQKGYVSPYVWELRAGDKSYGKFIIESLQIKEDMRNAKGRADRATASISLQQVPDFQVNDGRDLATKADLAAGKSVVSEK
ncbi:MAG: hypothetical protein ACO22S_05660, partial [Burkholderiaceae bacterium]